jgi:glycosyltransferase involved in cell wall biosynthesis
LCDRIEIVDRDPFHQNPVKALAGWLSPRPSAVVATYSPEMESAVSKLSEEWQPDVVVALTFVTAPYALKVKNVLRVVDVDNLMTRLMEDAFHKSRGIKERMRRLLAWWKFHFYEKWLYSQFDLCLSVTSKDQEKMAHMFHLPLAKIGVIPNGVTMEEKDWQEIVPKQNWLIFNGALTYQANFDAMEFFLREIFPRIRAEAPETHLKITGSLKGVALDQLPQQEHVEFTGYLEDVKSAVTESWACVVPLRIGGGTRLKILEAMALGVPVISSVKGAEGLDVTDGEQILLANTAEAFARQTLRILRDDDLRQKIAAAARQFVQEKYHWQDIQNHFCDLVQAIAHPKD